MATEKIAIVSARIGHGTQTHITEASVEGDKLVPMLVGCGSGFRNGMVSGQHGMVQLSEVHEAASDHYLVRNAARLAAYIEVLEGKEISFLCERCVKSTGRLVKFLKKQQAENK